MITAGRFRFWASTGFVDISGWMVEPAADGFCLFKRFSLTYISDMASFVSSNIPIISYFVKSGADISKETLLSS